MVLWRAGVWLVTAALALGGAASAQVAPVPPPVEQQTADCNAPVFATDQLVCSEPGLRALDMQLAAALASATEPNSKWFEPQSQWFLRRSRCAFSEDHAACAEAAYQERLALLRPLGSGTELQAVRCDDPEVTAIIVLSGRITLLGRQGNVLGVAQDASSQGPWQSFLAFSRRDRNMTVRSLQGDRLKCRRTGKRVLET